MYPTTRYQSPYMRSIYGFTRSVEERIPTLEKALDRYFDANFEAIIEEWQLLTDYELRDLEKRLDTVTGQIDNLYAKKTDIEKRAKTLDNEIKALEGGVK